MQNPGYVIRAGALSISLCCLLAPGSGVSPHPELPQGQMDSLLSIISSQRERFRSRNQELEAVSHDLSLTLTHTQTYFIFIVVFWRHSFLLYLSPAGESLHAADHAGPTAWTRQPESRQHQTLWENQIPAELPWQSMCVCSAWVISCWSSDFF